MMQEHTLLFVCLSGPQLDRSWDGWGYFATRLHGMGSRLPPEEDSGA